MGSRLARVRTARITTAAIAVAALAFAASGASIAPVSAQAQIAQEVRRATTELRAEVGTWAVDIAERLIRRSLRDEDHRRLVQEALARIESS